MPRATVEACIGLYGGRAASQAYEGGHFFSNGREAEVAAGFVKFAKRVL